MAYQYDPNQQGQFQDGSNGMQGPPQGMPPQQQQQQPMQGMQGMQQDGGSPAPFQQQGGIEGSSGSVSGEAKTTLW